MIKYNSYKDSGVEWIGEIPCGWKLTKVKYESEIFGRIGYRGYTVEDIVEEGEGVITISPSNIFNDVFNLNDVTYLSFDKYFQSPEIMIFENDIILVKTGSTIGKTSIIPHGVPEMTLNPQLVVLKNIRLNPKYYYYQTICNYFKESFYIEQTGSSTPTISQEKINNFPLLLPSDLEQHQIVSFLDTKTSLIDSLIEKTQRKIELLKEQRTSLINHVVTKGLNPNVPLKDSGVEWIGEIPSHWSVSKLKHLSKENLRSLPNSTNPNYELEYIEISDVNSDGVIGSPTHYIFSESPSRCRRIVQKGDVIVSTVRTYLKSIGLIENEVEDLICSTGFSVLTPDHNIISKYLFYVLRTEWFISKIISKSEGVSYPSIQSHKLMDTHVLKCSNEEQQQIVEFLDNKTTTIDTTITKEEKRIELLKEYRQSLISEVVTGKLKVVE